MVWIFTKRLPLVHLGTKAYWSGFGGQKVMVLWAEGYRLQSSKLPLSSFDFNFKQLKIVFTIASVWSTAEADRDVLVVEL